VQKRIDTLNDDKPARDELSRFLADFEGWQNSSAFWIDHIDRLTEVFPSTKQVYISWVEFTEGGEIKLEIQAKDEFQASKIVQAVNEIQVKGKPVYSAATVGAAVPSQDPEYSRTDHVNIQVLALVPVKATRR
jgi:hypothetical protein